MTSKQIDEALDKMQNAMQKLYKIVDRLEQRIAKLEKVLESHAKCIGELRVQTYMETKGEDNNE